MPWNQQARVNLETRAGCRREGGSWTQAETERKEVRRGLLEWRMKKGPCQSMCRARRKIEETNRRRKRRSPERKHDPRQSNEQERNENEMTQRKSKRIAAERPRRNGKFPIFTWTREREACLALSWSPERGRRKLYSARWCQGHRRVNGFVEDAWRRQIVVEFWDIVMKVRQRTLADELGLVMEVHG